MKGLGRAQAALRQGNADVCRVSSRTAFSITHIAPPAPTCNGLRAARANRASTPAWHVGTLRFSHRCFSQTAVAQSKKKGKVHKLDSREASQQTKEQQPSDSKGPKADPEDPFNFADIDHVYKKIDEHHEERLKKLLVGGRFNPDVVGNLRVHPDRHSSESYPLRELAQIAHRGGRNVSIIANEADYVKPIMSAVQSSPDYNQQPQRSPDNELELVIKIEPENPDDLARRVKDLCNGWRDQIREPPKKRLKAHAKWKDDKIINADDKKLLDTKLKKLQDVQMARIDAREKQALQEVAAKQNRL
ncbi:hypothetical protein NKR23_g11994 [Pleurostoma richardsiae]|uniref:Ribosome recycling factor domain-containing protein n=1 Tax=Pleurostoma richardsiae TaxID=41990 RepID=A0AA38RFU1_9PEZI|nr:hypothetical protein NKR23_g11994 [Pleurostoma richardsiae]